MYVFAYLCHIFNRRWRPLAPSPRMSNEQRDTGGGKGELPGTPGNSRAFGIIGTANSRELPGELPGVPIIPMKPCRELFLEPAREIIIGTASLELLARRTPGNSRANSRACQKIQGELPGWKFNPWTGGGPWEVTGSACRAWSALEKPLHAYSALRMLDQTISCSPLFNEYSGSILFPLRTLRFNSKHGCGGGRTPNARYG